ncbi:MAG: hypothetical protein Q8P49_01320 [Candidatus Liptonbacteria bacterium]|nr:hypothetical protein [Candidatus Liptonbacteria bacterium]
MRFKVIVVIVIVIAVAFVGYLIFSGLRNADQNLGGSPSNAPPQSVIVPLDPEITPSGEKITIGTAGGSVEINNFYKFAQGLDGEALIIRSTPEYQIIYSDEGSTFGIYVTGGAVDTVLKTAEMDMLSILGISQSQACVLTITWGVSPAVDKNLVGRSYPLSFCVPGVQ